MIRWGCSGGDRRDPLGGHPPLPAGRLLVANEDGGATDREWYQQAVAHAGAQVLGGNEQPGPRPDTQLSRAVTSMSHESTERLSHTAPVQSRFRRIRGRVSHLIRVRRHLEREVED